MGAQENRTKYRWQEVAQNVLYRMSVDGGDTNRSSPLMMHLVKTLVQPWLVK
jgi:hypothetical protein